MDKFGKSQSVKRVEDIRFLTGQGQYVDDIAPAEALVGYVFRSPMAHGTISMLDASEARTAPGVHLVLTADDLKANGVTEGMVATVVKNSDGTDGAAPRRPLLAEGRV
ncbi:MAG: xanthine dehydrogenase family protein molybdopterin-binding subunit, partial [Rhodobacteraceae bacterium]|nr:xanthine dehydrogenase family protein molybdopterin-binding subunit [Paracoccaceae bacterium]